MDFATNNNYRIRTVASITKYRSSTKEALTDKDFDLYQYRSFDFEWRDAQNPLQEKKIAEIIEEKLINKGLVRDRENPDLLVFLTFFEDRQDQYIPPTQQLSTRYNTTYNFITKQNETRQYHTTTTVGDYTRSTYMAELSIIMADAEKMKEGSGSVPPVVWSAYYSTTDRNRINRDRFVYNTSEAMFCCFPFPEVVGYEIAQYWYTGLGFDQNNFSRIVMVEPGSPADKAGIEKGDIIIKTDYGKIKANYTFNQPRKNRYYTKQKKEKIWYKNIEGLQYIIKESENNSTRKNITFTILRNKKKLTVTVPAVKASGYKYIYE